jgi:hypothetical protein
VTAVTCSFSVTSFRGCVNYGAKFKQRRSVSFFRPQFRPRRFLDLAGGRKSKPRRKSPTTQDPRSTLGKSKLWFLYKFHILHWRTVLAVPSKPHWRTVSGARIMTFQLPDAQPLLETPNICISDVVHGC